MGLLAKHLAQKAMVVFNGCNIILAMQLWSSHAHWILLWLLLLSDSKYIPVGSQTVTPDTLNPTTAGNPVKMITCKTFICWFAFSFSDRTITKSPCPCYSLPAACHPPCCLCSFTMRLFKQEKAAINTCWTRCPSHPLWMQHTVWMPKGS